MRIEDHVVSLYMRLQALEQRAAGTVRHGTVTDVDTAKQLVRLRLGGTDAKPMKSAWVPYAQQAAPGTGLKVHAPPKVGQNMTLMAQGGETRQAVAVPFTWSDNAGSPGSQDHPVVTFGQWKVEAKGDSIKVSFGGTSLEFTPSKLEVKVGDASILLDANTFKMVADLVKAEGASLKHNAKEVGDSHGHVTAPPGLPGPPV